MKCLCGLVVLAAASGWAQEIMRPPIVEVTVSGLADGQTPTGWPLTIAVTISSSDGRVFDAGLKDRSWTDGVSVEIRNSNGEVVAWPQRLISAGPQTLSVRGAEAGTAIFALSPELSAGLAEGQYSVRAGFETTTGAEPWSWVGFAGSGLTPLTVIAEPDPLSSDQEAIKYLLLADYEEGQGHFARALRWLDLLLEKQADQLAAVTARADVFMAAERWAEALAEYQRAIRIARRLRPDPGHPPAELIRRQAAAAAKLARLE